VRLDEQANCVGEPKINAAESAVSVWVIPTNEDLMIARHTYNLLRRTMEAPCIGG
jgi:acetate kinase